jgi:hypothetical protein
VVQQDTGQSGVSCSQVLTEVFSHTPGNPCLGRPPHQGLTRCTIPVRRTMCVMRDQPLRRLLIVVVECRLLRVLALSLSLPPDFFLPFFTQPMVGG